MRIVALWRYPIKGAAGLLETTVPVHERGLAYDRRWMLVNEEGVFCSQRDLPELGRIQPVIDGDALVIDQELRVPLHEEGGEIRRVKVWKDEVQAARVGEQADAWFSARLGQKVSLVRMNAQSERQTPEGSPVSFADGYPVLICSTSSLQDLRERNGEKTLQMRAFRPNIVVEGAQPWAEDQWRTLVSDELRLEIVSPCMRCKVTTLDPDDPHRVHPNKEPLRTLATFRKSEKGVSFGVNAQLSGSAGILKLDQALYAV